ncbi:MAG TPA: ABC transporter permease [Bryobacteraceae bacterium]|nr:ABC transporter permease [Bryobacteraceae bacterium]
MLTEAVHTLRWALRSLKHSRGFAAAAILTIALGVGSNTSVFSVIRAVLLRPLPFRDPERLVMLWETHPEIRLLQVAAPDFQDWQRDSHSFDEMAAYTLQAMNKATLTGYGEPVQVQGTMVSSNLLTMLGIQPIVGRSILPSEDKGREHVALISESLWRRKFDADRSIVGKAIRLDGGEFTVVGILQRRQAFPVWADLWMPLSLLEPELETTRRFHPLEVIARLRRGVSEDRAQAEMQGIARRLARDYPATNRTEGAVVVPLAEQLSGSVRPALLVVWTAVGLILLIACVNVSHLLLARGAAMRRAAAIRAALGAGRAQLIRLFLTESLAIAVLGGALGLLMAVYLTPVLTSLAAAEIPRLADVSIDRGVFAFTFAISAMCGVLFGLPVLKQTSALSFGPRLIRMGAVLVTAEIALSLAVLIGAGLLVKSFATLLHVDPGFRGQNVLTVQVHLPVTGYDWEKYGKFFRDALLPRIRQLPGVVQVAAANTAPMTIDRTEHSRFATRFGIVGRTFDPGRFPVAQTRWVSPDYFAVIGIPLKRGRLLTDSDHNKSVMLVSESLAQRFFPGQDAVGQRILMDVMTPKPNAVEIVGVVGDTREFALDIEPEPMVYSVDISPTMSLMIRTASNADNLAPAIRRAALSANLELGVDEVRTMENVVEDSVTQRRFALLLVGGFALIAAALAGIGIYGVLSYSVATRTRELGLRIALGAGRRDVLRLLLKESLMSLVPGLSIGCGIAFALTRIMASLLYQVAPTDPAAYAGAALFLSAITLLASYLPARRAVAIDPMQSLREQ